MARLKHYERGLLAQLNSIQTLTGFFAPFCLGFFSTWDVCMPTQPNYLSTVHAYFSYIDVPVNWGHFDTCGRFAKEAGQPSSHVE